MDLSTKVSIIFYYGKIPRKKRINTHSEIQVFVRYLDNGFTPNFACASGVRKPLELQARKKQGESEKPYEGGKTTMQEYSESQSSFQQFINKYRVARNMKVGNTERLLEICMEWHREKRWLEVDTLADQLYQESGLMHGRPVSLASKVMFLMRPDWVLPYDSQAKATLGISTEKNYALFLEKAINFGKEQQAEIDFLLARSADWLDELERPFLGCIDNLSIIRRQRLLDKLLWANIV